MVCRLCEEESNLIDLFSENVSKAALTYIQQLTNVHIKEDDVASKQICKNCLKSVLNMTLFRFNSIITDLKLQGNAGKICDVLLPQENVNSLCNSKILEMVNKLLIPKHDVSTQTLSLDSENPNTSSVDITENQAEETICKEVTTTSTISTDTKLDNQVEKESDIISELQTPETQISILKHKSILLLNNLYPNLKIPCNLHEFNLLPIVQIEKEDLNRRRRELQRLNYKLRLKRRTNQDYWDICNSSKVARMELPEKEPVTESAKKELFVSSLELIPVKRPGPKILFTTQTLTEMSSTEETTSIPSKEQTALIPSTKQTSAIPLTEENPPEIPSTEGSQVTISSTEEIPLAIPSTDEIPLTISSANQTLPIVSSIEPTCPAETVNSSTTVAKVVDPPTITSTESNVPSSSTLTSLTPENSDDDETELPMSLLRVHTSNTVHICKVCQKVYTTLSGLKHHRVKHPTCRLCFKTFGNKYTYSKHQDNCQGLISKKLRIEVVRFDHDVDLKKRYWNVIKQVCKPKIIHFEEEIQLTISENSKNNIEDPLPVEEDKSSNSAKNLEPMETEDSDDDVILVSFPESLRRIDHISPIKELVTKEEDITRICLEENADENQEAEMDFLRETFKSLKRKEQDASTSVTLREIVKTPVINKHKVMVFQGAYKDLQTYSAIPVTFIPVVTTSLVARVIMSAPGNQKTTDSNQMEIYDYSDIEAIDLVAPKTNKETNLNEVTAGTRAKAPITAAVKPIRYGKLINEPTQHAVREQQQLLPGRSRVINSNPNHFSRLVNSTTVDNLVQSKENQPNANARIIGSVGDANRSVIVVPPKGTANAPGNSQAGKAKPVYLVQKHTQPVNMQATQPVNKSKFINLNRLADMNNQRIVKDLSLGQTNISNKYPNVQQTANQQPSHPTTSGHPPMNNTQNTLNPPAYILNTTNINPTNILATNNMALPAQNPQMPLNLYTVKPPSQQQQTFLQVVPPPAYQTIPSYCLPSTTYATVPLVYVTAPQTVTSTAYMRMPITHPRQIPQGQQQVVVQPDNTGQDQNKKLRIKQPWEINMS